MNTDTSHSNDQSDRLNTELNSSIQENIFREKLSYGKQAAEADLALEFLFDCLLETPDQPDIIYNLIDRKLKRSQVYTTKSINASKTKLTARGDDLSNAFLSSFLDYLGGRRETLQAPFQLTIEAVNSDLSETAKGVFVIALSPYKKQIMSIEVAVSALEALFALHNKSLTTPHLFENVVEMAKKSATGVEGNRELDSRLKTATSILSGINIITQRKQEEDDRSKDSRQLENAYSRQKNDNLKRLSRALKDNPADETLLQQFERETENMPVKERAELRFAVYKAAYKVNKEAKFRKRYMDIYFSIKEKEIQDLSSSIASAADTQLNDRLEKAITDLKQRKLGEMSLRIEEDPSDAPSVHEYCRLFTGPDKSREVVNQLQSLLRQTPLRKVNITYYMLGQEFYEQAKFGPARYAFEQALANVTDEGAVVDNSPGSRMDIELNIVRCQLKVAEHSKDSSQLVAAEAALNRLYALDSSNPDVAEVYTNWEKLKQESHNS